MKHHILIAGAALLGAAACTSMRDEDPEPRTTGAPSPEHPYERRELGGIGDLGEVGAREAGASTGAYEGEVELRGTVVDVTAFLLRGERAPEEPSGATLALETSDGLFLLLPSGESTSDGLAADPDAAGQEDLHVDLTTLLPGDEVRVTGEVYRRGGLAGIEVESVERE